MTQNTATVTPISSPQVPGARWQPFIGDEARNLINGIVNKGILTRESADQILNTAASILARGADPTTRRGQETGLVVGYVQSGKTLSFTTVAALARDNNFPIVIVITGTKNNLRDQSTERLLKDLKVNEVDGPPRWTCFQEPKLRDHHQIISQIIEDWACDDIPKNEKATILITVKKQWQVLNRLTELVSALNLDEVPVLIIDDEADQASLNTRVRQGQESTTYQRILALRDALPCHTLLQYTATPQAPLLINIIDTLSPSFVEILEPGDGYVGGVDFFGAQQDLVEVIPPHDIPSADNPLSSPPESLVEALRTFYIGAAAGRIEGWDAENSNRSMLIHPSRTTDMHFEYCNAAQRIAAEWQRVFSLPEGNADRNELLEDFYASYQDLQQTVPNLPPFEEIVRMLQSLTLRRTQIMEVNTRGEGGRRQKTPNIEWRNEYGWILIGGQAMDRGFTVKGLTVTYMPRGIGVGSADTLQQRARFFGYKRDYLGHCRIYLESEALSAFEAYVEHEEEMRRELQNVRDSGIPLNDWKRRFVLSPDLSPCRKNVIQHDYARGNFSDEWFFPKMAEIPQEIAQANTDVITQFRQQYNFVEDTTYPSQRAAQQHLVCPDIPLESALSDLLVKYRIVSEADTAEMTGALLQLSKALDYAREHSQSETAAVYIMRPNSTGKRSVDRTGRVTTVRRLFQGPTESNIPGERYTYPGDFAFLDRHRVTIQIHTFNIENAGVIVAHNVPIIVTWIPERMNLDWVTQEQRR